jgi:hypothetical protein
MLFLPMAALLLKASTKTPIEFGRLLPVLSPFQLMKSPLSRH